MEEVSCAQEPGLRPVNELPAQLFIRSVEEAVELEKVVKNENILKDWEACKRRVYELVLAMKKECRNHPGVCEHGA